jgi:hypothetical protein
MGQTALLRVNVKRLTAVPEVSDWLPTRHEDCQPLSAMDCSIQMLHNLLYHDVHLPSAEFLRHPLRPLGRGSANKRRVFNTGPVLTFRNTDFSDMHRNMKGDRKVMILYLYLMRKWTIIHFFLVKYLLQRKYVQHVRGQVTKQKYTNKYLYNGQRKIKVNIKKKEKFFKICGYLSAKYSTACFRRLCLYFLHSQVC